jgi:WD40 repeat protein/serine/threonine protein kinase
MADETIVQDLLSRWEKLQQLGYEMPLDVLCQGYPDRVQEEVRKRVEELERVGRQFLVSTVDGSADPGAQAGEPAPHPVTLGRFRLEELVGEGGFGRVWRAFDPELQRQVAIKAPRPHLLGTSPAVETFLKEARKVARLEHRAILPVYELGREGDIWYIVSMWIEGGDLGKRLPEKRPPLREAVRLVAEVAEALHYAHLRGLVHRDVKPGNILLDRQGRPFLADFGLAVTEQELQAEHPAILGTLAYMSPEQARGDSHLVDGRADVYSLGVVFYELLTGRRPFGEKNAAALREQILNREPWPPRSIDDALPRELERICLRCLTKHVSQRYPTAGDLAEELRAWDAEFTRPHPERPLAPTLSAPPPESPVRAFLRPLDFGAELVRLGSDFLGRDWLDMDLENWLTREDSRVFFVTGDPGAGKSAYLAHVVTKYPQVVAHHFCVASLAESLDPMRFVQSLAGQLASRLEDYRRSLADVKPDMAAEPDPGTLLRRLIADPLRALPEEGTYLVVVDGLDEGAAPGGPGTIARLLQERLGDFPPWLRLVLSARKDPDVLDLFSRTRVHEIETDRPGNLADVAEYVAAKFHQPEWAARFRNAGVDPQTTARLICHKSEGNFLYVVQALEALQAGQIHPGRPESFPEGLVGLYQGFFERVFPGRQGYEAFRPLLDVLTAAREPLTAGQLADFLGRDRFEVEADLQKVAVFFPERDGRFGPSHKSLIDWLRGLGGKSKAYRVNLAAGHRRIAEALLKAFRAGRRDRFLLAHLPTHLIEAERWDDLEALLTDLTFVEAKCAAGMTFALVMDYNAALAAWPGHEPDDPFGTAPPPIPDWVRECTAAIAQGRPDPHPDKGLGPVVAGLRQLSRYERRLRWQPPLFRGGETLPAAYHRADPATTSALAQMRQTEAASRGGAAPCSAETPAARVGSFAIFVATSCHLLDRHRNDVVVIARNHAGDGLVVERAQALVEKIKKPWVARDPRPAALPARPACFRVLRGHTDLVLGVALSGDGRLAVSAGDDGTVRSWDVASGECVAVLPGHSGGVNSIALTPDGHLAVSAGRDKTLRVWDVTARTCLRTLEGHTHQVLGVSVTPDGTLAISSGKDNTVRLWDLASGKCRWELSGHTTRVNSTFITPDGRLAISAGWDDFLRVWDLNWGECVRVLRGHSFSVTGVAWAAHAPTALSGSIDQTLCLWNVGTGECLRLLTADGHRIEGVGMTPDGTLAVSGGWDGTLRVWDLTAGECIRVLPTAPVSAVSLTPDGKLAATAHPDHAVRVWDLHGGVSVPITAGHTDIVFTFAWTKDGRQAVSASRDGTLRVWDAANGECRRVLKGHSSWVRGVALSADGARAVSSSWDASLYVWDLATGAWLDVLHGHNAAVSDVALSADGRRALSASHDRTVRFWDLATGSCIHVLGDRTTEMVSIALTRDGRLGVSGGWDGSLWLWDLVAGKGLGAWYGHRGWVSRLTLTADGRTLGSAGNDGVIRLWDVQSQRCLQTLQGHSQGVMDVKLTADGTLALSASMDSSARVWSATSGKCLALYHAGSEVCSVSDLWPSGHFACGTVTGQLHQLHLENFP